MLETVFLGPTEGRIYWNRSVLASQDDGLLVFLDDMTSRIMNEKTLTLTREGGSELKVTVNDLYVDPRIPQTQVAFSKTDA